MAKRSTVGQLTPNFEDFIAGWNDLPDSNDRYNLARMINSMRLAENSLHTKFCFELFFTG